MAQGLRKHRHCYYEVNSKYYYDNHRNCMVRNTHYECMICGHKYHEVSELSQGPPKKKVNQVYWKRIRTGIGIVRCLFILSEIRRKEDRR